MKLQSLIRLLATVAASTIPVAWAADTGSPAGATGQCKDGTYTTSQTHKGACSDHGGVKAWFADKASSPATDTKTKVGEEAKPQKPAADKPSIATGGSGKVWVNSKSRVYHCEKDRWYGKTKAGEYMTEAEAKAKGNHPDHGKPCSA